MSGSQTWAGRSRRGRRPGLFQGRNNNDFNDDSRSFNNSDNVKSSVFFLPRHLQEANPWEDETGGRDFEQSLFRDDTSHYSSQKSSSRESASYKSRRSRDANDGDSDNYRYNSIGCSHFGNCEHKRSARSRRGEHRNNYPDSNAYFERSRRQEGNDCCHNSRGQKSRRDETYSHFGNERCCNEREREMHNCDRYVPNGNSRFQRRGNHNCGQQPHHRQYENDERCQDHVRHADFERGYKGGRNPHHQRNRADNEFDNRSSWDFNKGGDRWGPRPRRNENAQHNKEKFRNDREAVKKPHGSSRCSTDGDNCQRKSDTKSLSQRSNFAGGDFDAAPEVELPRRVGELVLDGPNELASGPSAWDKAKTASRRVRDRRPDSRTRDTDTESDYDISHGEVNGQAEVMSKDASTKADSETFNHGPVVMVAPKKEPAIRTNKVKEKLLTNFWEISVQSRMIYRYDVAFYMGTPEIERAYDYLRGPRDDSAMVARRKLCLSALQYALAYYRILSEEAAVVHDGGSMLFSSEDLMYALKEHNGILRLNFEDLPVQIKKMVHRVDFNTITIEISPCRNAAASFDMADLSAQMNRNWAALDRSWKQFYELLTNQDAILSKASVEMVGYGFERMYGARKGIKFIEGRRRSPSSVVAALVLDHRVGLFFKNQNLMESVREVTGLREVDGFDFSSKRNSKWNEVNDYVKGVRMKYIGSASNPLTFVAIGISKEPIKDLRSVLPNKAKTEVSVLEKFADTKMRINPYWPAVVWRLRGQKQYFPMELLEVEPNQRVPLEKQLAAKSARNADKPGIRLGKIYGLLEELNLHQNGWKNEFLRAFGVTVSSFPKTVDGFRRQAPQVTYGGKQPCAVDNVKYNWRQAENTRYVECGSVERILIVHCDRTGNGPRAVGDCLQRMFKKRGITHGRIEYQYIGNIDNMMDMEDRLREIFKSNKDSKDSLLIIFIDRLNSKSHEYLKLLERRYLIPTQQLTEELAVKFPRQPQSCANFVSKTNLKLGGINYEVVPESFAENIWIARGKTLIIGYDVCHPGRPTRDEIMNKMPPKKPSVVGFSFNGAVHRETFIGDYHYQTPRRERVNRNVLNARVKWMLDLFTKNRGVWPESVVITRDGVSEGQYRMVIEDELAAIKEACEEFGNVHGRESWLPHFTVIVATKRHNARFFVETNKYIDNPKPATVVDTDVVRCDITEFYMQSHRAIQGTAKCTSYQVIVDENDMSMDGVQSLMLALTFHHQISEGPVSLPEPVYQADEWAKRGKYIWNAYMDRHIPILERERGDYATEPIDFEAMTEKLAFWRTKLEDRRVNA